MPFKFHASRRHHIPRAKYRVMNWPDYDRGLVRRGDIRFWIDESALEQWDPPRATSIPPPDTPHGGSEREHHAAEIASKGRMNWQKRQGYGLRALGETAMARVKRLNGGKLTARTFQSQQTEIAMQIDALNRSIRAAKPNTIRIR